MKLLHDKYDRKAITVELSPRDQDVIYSALGTCGGHSDGPRGNADQMRDILFRQGAITLPRSKDHSGFFLDSW